MTAQQAKKKGYTHSGHMFNFIPVYIKFEYDPEIMDESFEPVGKNAFWDFVLTVFCGMDVFFGTNKSFEIYVNEEEL